MSEKVLTLKEAARSIKEARSLGIGGIMLMRKPMALIREIIRSGYNGLEVYSFLASIDVDLLLGAGVCRSVHTSYVGFEQLGLAPNFTRLAKAGEIGVNEYSEYLFVTGLRAAQMGLPFLPTRGALGSQLLEQGGFHQVSCPYTGQKLVAVPALSPDVAIIHVALADVFGNVYAPEIPDFLLGYDFVLARAAKKVIVSAEKVIGPGEGRKFSARAALFSYEVDAVVEVPRGAHPGGLPPDYGPDYLHLMEYLELSRDNSLSQYLEKYIWGAATEENTAG